MPLMIDGRLVCLVKDKRRLLSVAEGETTVCMTDSLLAHSGQVCICLSIEMRLDFESAFST